MKQRKFRWVAFENLGDPISRDEVISLINKLSMRLYGVMRAGDLDFLLVEFDAEHQRGIIRVPHKSLDMLRTIFFFLRRKDEKRIIINDILVSGTLKTLREKLRKLEAER